VTKAVVPLPGVAGSRSAVNQLPKNVVRENRTLRSVGTIAKYPPNHSLVVVLAAIARAPRDSTASPTVSRIIGNL
jgi:hypothetical protein